MAEFGLRYPCFKKNGSSAGVVLGKAVAANLTVTLASGELFADDGLAEQLSEFASGSVAMETDNLADEVAGEIYGCTVSNGLVVYSKDDTAPEGVLGYLKVLMIQGVKKYRVIIYPRAKAALGNENGQTRGSSITFQTAQTTFTIFADSTGKWKKTKEFDSEDAAVTFLYSRCGITPSDGTPNAKLAALTVGTLTLSPAFNSDIYDYTAETSAASNVVTAIAADDDATVEITLGASTTVTNGSPAAWASGENTLTIVVTNDDVTRTYTVKVTKS